MASFDDDRPSGVRLFTHLIPRRRVSYDDMRFFLYAPGCDTPSSQGAMCERARDGLTGPADAKLAQEKQEVRFLRGRPERDCLARLASRSSIRWRGCVYPTIRGFARRTGIADGRVAVEVLAAYYPWATKWESHGLYCVYEWMRTQDAAMAAIKADLGKSPAQQFRENKHPKALRLASAMFADARLILASWIEIWNRGAPIDPEPEPETRHAA